jgi:virulence-associated protein VapD
MSFTKCSPINHDVYVVKTCGSLWPCRLEDNEIFIRDKGRKNIKNLKKTLVEKLPQNWTLDNAIAFIEKYNIDVFMASLQDDYGFSLYGSNSDSFKYRCEILNMLDSPELYSEYINLVKEIDDDINKTFNSNGLKRERNSLYFEDQYVGYVRLTNFFKYVDHTFYWFRSQPSLDPMRLDDDFEDVMKYMERYFNIDIRYQVISVIDRILFFAPNCNRQQVERLLELENEMNAAIRSANAA